jgi:hypothetical protein
MRITNKELRRRIQNLLLRESKILSEGWSGQGYVNAAIALGRVAGLTPEVQKQMAQDGETKMLLSQLIKKDQWAAGHEATRNHALETGDTQLLVLMDNIRNVVRPRTSVGAPLTGLNIDNTTGGGQVYAFHQTLTTPADGGGTTSSTSTLSSALNNFITASSVTGGTFNPVDFMGRCMATSATATLSWPGNMGERLEVAVAATFASYLPGVTFGSRMDNAPGRDLECIDGWNGSTNPRFEIKFTESQDGNPNTLFGASVPTNTATDKYFVFLTSERTYVLHSPILAGILEVDSGDAPVDTTQAENLILGHALVKNLLDEAEIKEEFVRIVGDYSRTQLATGSSGLTTDLMHAVLNGINALPSQQRERVIFFMARKIINSRLRTSPGSTQTKRASRSGGVATITTDEYPHYRAWYNRYTRGTTHTDPEGNSTRVPTNIHNATVRLVEPAEFLLVFGQPGHADTETEGVLLDLVRILSNQFGLQQTIGVILPPAPRLQDKESGSFASTRATTATVTGNSISDYLNAGFDPNDQNPPSARAKANLIFNMLNNNAIPTDIKNQILGQLKLDKMQAQGHTGNWDFPKLARVVREIHGDQDAMAESLMELLRSRDGRRNIWSKYILDTRDSVNTITNAIVSTYSTSSLGDLTGQSFPRTEREKVTGFYSAAGEYAGDIKFPSKSEIGKKVSEILAKVDYDAIAPIIQGGNEWWTSFDRGEHWSGSENWDDQMFEILFIKNVGTQANPRYGADSNSLQIRQRVNTALQTQSLKNFATAANDALLKYVDDILDRVASVGKADTDLKQQIQQNLDPTNLDSIENNYKSSLDSQELANYNALQRGQQIQQMIASDVINTAQATKLRRIAGQYQTRTRAGIEHTSGPHKAIKAYLNSLLPSDLSSYKAKSRDEQIDQLLSNNILNAEMARRLKYYDKMAQEEHKEDLEAMQDDFEDAQVGSLFDFDEDDSAPFSIFSESREYTNILKKLLYTAKKRQ